MFEIGYGLWLPEGLEDDIRKVCADGGKGVAQYERALWIVSEITRRGEIDALVESGYARTGYNHFERGCPRKQVNPILTCLRQARVIERDDHYLPAVLDPVGLGKSYGYRLGPDYRDRPRNYSRGLSPSVANTLTENYRRRRMERDRDPLPWPYSELDRMAKQIRLSSGCVDPKLHDQLCEINRWGLVDEFGQRFHETHQTVPRRHRKELRLGENEDPLFALDISSSQPLILARWVQEEGEKRRGEESRQEERGMREREQAGRGEERARGGRNGGHIEWPEYDALVSNVDEIIDLCCDGDLYQRLVVPLECERGSGLRHEDPYRGAVDRDVAKKEWMVSCMAVPKVILDSRAGRAVRAVWPHFGAAVYRLASETPDKYIPQTLQRRESEMVIRGAAGRILAERPDIPFGTVHDAIICHELHVAYIRGCIEDCFQNGIGVVPQVKVKPYGGE